MKFSQVVGIEETTGQPNVNVYPNPGNGDFSIEFDKMQKKVNIEVINTVGQTIVRQTNSEVQKIQVSIEVPAGLYFLKITSEDQKFVKEIILQ